MTITVNGQEISGDDIKAVQSAIRKAKKEERAAQAARTAAQEVAANRAYRAGYTVLCHVADRDCYRSLEFFAPGGKYAPARVLETYPYLRVQADCEGARIDAEFPGWDYAGCVGNLAGSCLAIFLRDRDRPDVVSGVAIGAHDGQCQILNLPGIQPELFNPADHESQPS